MQSKNSRVRVRISPDLPSGVTVTSPKVNSRPTLFSRVLKAHKGSEDRRRSRASTALDNNEDGMEVLHQLHLPMQFKFMIKLCVALGIGVEERKTVLGQVLFYSCYMTLVMVWVFLFNESRRLGNISAVFQVAIFFVMVVFIFSYWACRPKLLVENCFVKERLKTKEILRLSKREDLEALCDKQLQKFKPPWKFALCVHPVVWLHVFSVRKTFLEALTVSIVLQLMHFPSHVFWNCFRYVSFLHSLQIDAFRDALCVFKTLDSNVESALVRSQSGGVADLPEMTEFFQEEWISNMTIKFGQIRDTLGKTSLHFGRDSAIIICVLLVALGLVGLTMFIDENQITVQNTIVAAFVLYLIVELVSFPIKANSSLSKTREVAWECYGELNARELNAHTLLAHQDGWSELDIIKYKQRVNAAKHLLNLVQTNREGIKFIGEEVSVGLILKLLSIVLSCFVIIVRSGDLSKLTWKVAAMGGTIDHNITSTAGM